MTRRTLPTLLLVILGLGWLAACSSRPSQTAVPALDGPTWELTGGRWFDGQGFKSQTFYIVGTKFTERRPARLDHQLDLGGGFVIPPFGEGHNHNIEKEWGLEAQIHKYLEQGIFYVSIANSIRELNTQIRDRLGTPQSIHVAFANGGLTAPGGHPIRLYEEVLRERAYRGVAKEWFADRAYYLIESPEDLERKWPLIRSQPPDFIKVFLLYSEEYAIRRDDPTYFGRKGLDPALLPLIVARAHGEGLRVAVHVETAEDFRTAISAGADLITHLPGYMMPQGGEVARFTLTEEDARRAGEQRVVVSTTASLAALRVKDPERLRLIQETQRQNLKLLLAHGVAISIGTDDYARTSLDEALYLHELGVFDNLTLLRLWCETTPRSIFPGRRIGRLEAGFEASFLVLDGNPIEDFDQVRAIRQRFKQGEPLMLKPVAPGG